MFHADVISSAAPRESKADAWWRGPECAVTAFWLMVLSATIAYGATVANLTLTGTVAQVLDISVTPTAASGNLDLNANQANLHVANVTVVSNNAAGYGVSVRSNNVTNGDCAAPCLYSPTADDSLAFSLLRNSTTVTFSGDTATFAQTAAPSSVGGDVYTAGITYNGATALLGAATNYGEILTFTVSAN